MALESLLNTHDINVCRDRRPAFAFPPLAVLLIDVDVEWCFWRGCFCKSIRCVSTYDNVVLKG